MKQRGGDHPGTIASVTAHRGRQRKGRSAPRGRPVDPTVLGEVRHLLGASPRRRDLLLEYLHLLQDTLGCLPQAYLAALADELHLAEAEVYEVATFYDRFDVVHDGEPCPPPLTVRVCDGIACVLAGSDPLFKQLEHDCGDEVRVLAAPCMGRCDLAPAVMVGYHPVAPAKADTVLAAIRSGASAPSLPDHVDLDSYLADGGYRTLDACRRDRRTVADVLDALDVAALRGLGGAGFPTARKWRIVGQQPGPRLLAVNCDESEPGTFKDRHCLENDPHRMFEGALIAAWAVDATACYFYVRDEYPAIRAVLDRELDALRGTGRLDALKVHVRRGAGAYICGEESAMLESIEGKRGLPRNRPPYVAEVGLFGRPTLVNNVETLYRVREVLEAASATDAAVDKPCAWRSFSVSGRVREPGVKRAPAGICARVLIDEYCGGMLPGHRFSAFLPGGASGGILPASLGDLPLDFGTLEPHGGFIGSAAVVVLSDQDDPRAVALNLMRFFADESCGQCTPCRVGTEKAVALMQQGVWDRGLLSDLADVMADASICGLGQAAANPIRSLLRHFPECIG